MSARDWRSVITEAATLLDDTWHIIGTGRRTYLLRTPVEWWVQYISYENTTLGRLIGWQGFLGRPVPATQSGDGGVNGDHFVFPGEPRVRPDTDLFSPSGIADFARAVTETTFDPVLDLRNKLAETERTLKERQEKGHPYAGFARNRLVALRIVCGSRSKAELIEDVRWVLDDPRRDGYGPISSSNGTARTVTEFFTTMLEALEDEGRVQVESLIAQTRSETLNVIGVPDHHIAPLVFPPPLVTT